MPHVQFLAVRGGYGPQIRRCLPNVEMIDSTLDITTAVYARTRILLMPSRVETYGRTALEAACSGIPTIAHPTPGLIESLGDAATFVDRSSITSWVAAIDRLFDPAEWLAASRRALARAEQLDPAGDLDRFCTSIESLVGVPA